MWNDSLEYFFSCEKTEKVASLVIKTFQAENMCFFLFYFDSFLFSFFELKTINNCIIAYSIWWKVLESS